MDITSAEAPDRASIGRADSIYRKVAWRLVPLLFVCYVIAYLDRVNVGFAKLQMLSDLHFSEAIFGLGAGVFFLGYFLFEVPSNLMLHKVGARRWIARIMITWSLLSICTALVKSPLQFYVLRFLLGVAEAGFYPGILLYLTYWFPSHRRGRMTALITAGNPVSGLIGGPLSGAIMSGTVGVLSLSGWQWLFILEALPGVLLGFIVLRHLDDRVQHAKWLDDDERKFIQREIANDQSVHTHGSIRSAFTSARVWLLALILFCIISGSYALSFWQPTIIKSLGVANVATIGLISAIPYGAALISMILVSRSADRMRERRWHVIVPALFAASGFLICGTMSGHPFWSVVGLAMVAMGIVSALPMFWALPTAFLGGTGAAAGIALINSTGNLAGFLSPTVIGWLKEQTGSLSSGLYLVACTLTLAAFLVWKFIPARLVNR